MKIQNPFRLGLLGGLGVLVAIGIGFAITGLGTIIAYVGAAVFIALGLDPLVSWLEKKNLPRWSAIVTVLAGVLAIFTGFVFALVPVITEQVNRLSDQIPDAVDAIVGGEARAWAESTFPALPVGQIIDDAIDSVNSNVQGLLGNVVDTGIAVANGLFGVVIVLILTLYFVASLSSIKRALYQLVPMSRREKFVDIAEQVSTAVGRYVIGQASLALVNGVLSFIFLSIIGAEYPALLAFVAFLFSLVPLVGTLTGSIIIVLSQLALQPDSPATWITAGVYYLVYMQVEAYLLSPLIMNRAVKVPGVLVVIAALTGGTLGGILGALVAIPVAASILIIVKQVVVPRQNTL